MRYFKEYCVSEIIVSTRYLFQSNFHQKLHTAPYEPHRPWNIWSHFVSAVSNSGILLWTALVYWKWVSLSTLCNLARRNSHSGQDLVGMEQVWALVCFFFFGYKVADEKQCYIVLVQKPTLQSCPQILLQLERGIVSLPDFVLCSQPWWFCGRKPIMF